MATEYFDVVEALFEGDQCSKSASEFLRPRNVLRSVLNFPILSLSNPMWVTVKDINLRRFINLLIFFIQCSITFILILSIYMTFVLLDYKGGIDGFVGATIFQPILGGLISAFTIVICLVIGLPIRLGKKIHSWWTKNFLLSILGTFTGLILLFASSLSAFKETINTTIENQTIIKEMPNLTLVFIGWFLTAFSTLHVFPSEKIKLWTENIVRRSTGMQK